LAYDSTQAILTRREEKSFSGLTEEFVGGFDTKERKRGIVKLSPSNVGDGIE
jgi:hypothetical protein